MVIIINIYVEGDYKLIPIEKAFPNRKPCIVLNDNYPLEVE